MAAIDEGSFQIELTASWGSDQYSIPVPLDPVSINEHVRATDNNALIRNKPNLQGNIAQVITDHDQTSDVGNVPAL